MNSSPWKASWDSRIDALWTAYYRDPEAVHDGIAHSRQQFAGDATLLAWADTVDANAHHHLGESAQRDWMLERARSVFNERQDEAGLAACRSVQAGVAMRAGRWSDAIALLNRNDEVPPEQRHPCERWLSTGRRRHAHLILEQFDAALHDSLRLVDIAAGQDDPIAAEANALTLLGGLEADLFSLEDALRHCVSAYKLADLVPVGEARALTARNLAYVLDALGRHGEALAIVEPLLSVPDVPGQRENRCLLYATVLLHAGELDRAQAFLDESVGAREGDVADLNGWTATQTEAHLARGDPAKAREVCESYLNDAAQREDTARSPLDTMRVYRAAAKACAALGDPAAALRHHEAAFAAYETLVGRAARARRITLEVEHELERERADRDQAQRRQHEAEAERKRLDAVNRALEAASLAKTHFLAAASHDLRQPVQALMMYTASLKLEPVTEAQHALISRVDESVTALARMFDGLLDISRLDAGVVATHTRQLNLASLAQRLADENGALAMAQGLTARLRLPRGVARATIVTRSDPMMLERCLRNLLDNARKYTPSGGLVLAIRPRDAAGQALWRIEIRDTGIGIPSQHQMQVFDEFFQVDADTRRADEARGMGLGLAIVQRMVRLLGHGLGLQSRAGFGTRVWIDVPRLAPVEPGITATPDPGVQGFAPLRVAVIEDDAAVRNAISALLTRWGHRVCAGRTAAEALAALRCQGGAALQAVITDLRLGTGGDGLAMVAQLRRELGDALPALVVTGESAPDALQRLRDSGLTWLPKPVPPVRLRSWLQGVSVAQGRPAPGPAPTPEPRHSSQPA